MVLPGFANGTDGAGLFHDKKYCPNADTVGMFNMLVTLFAFTPALVTNL